MERLRALETALKILQTARLDVVNTNPGAYNFLARVTQYIKSESDAAFTAEFRERA